MTMLGSGAVLGEVVATSTREIVGEKHQSHAGMPTYGAFVLIGKSNPSVGVIHNLETTSIDSHRRPVALGRGEDNVMATHPHLSALLRSQFQALLIGKFDEGRFRFGFSGMPPDMHSDIRDGEEALVAIGQDPDFLRLLHESGKPPADELILQACRRMFEAVGYRGDEMVRIGKTLSDIYRDDYDTLRRLMTRIEAWSKA